MPSLAKKSLARRSNQDWHGKRFRLLPLNAKSAPSRGQIHHPDETEMRACNETRCCPRKLVDSPLLDENLLHRLTLSIVVVYANCQIPSFNSSRLAELKLYSEDHLSYTHLQDEVANFSIEDLRTRRLLPEMPLERAPHSRDLLSDR